MATANEEFPRGWTFSNVQVAGTAAQIVVAGIAGVSHILDRLIAKLSNASPGAASAINVQVLDGATVLFTWSLICPATISADQMDFDGLELTCLPGNALTVKFLTVTPVGYIESIAIEGHDV